MTLVAPAPGADKSFLAYTPGGPPHRSSPGPPTSLSNPFSLAPNTLRQKMFGVEFAAEVLGEARSVSTRMFLLLL